MARSIREILLATGLWFSSLYELADATSLERRGCSGNNLIRALKDDRYSAYASPWCSSYISIPVVTSTATGGVATETSFSPNSNTVTVTETDTFLATASTTVLATSTIANPSTRTVTVYSYSNPQLIRTVIAYTGTQTVTVTLSKTAAVAKRTVSIPDSLDTILSKYSPSSLTSACSCLSVPPSTTIVTAPATTTTQVVQSAAATVILTTGLSSTVNVVYSSTVIISTVGYTTTRVVQGEPEYTATTTVSTGYTVSSTVCAYTNSPVSNPSFSNGLDKWTTVIGGGQQWVSVGIDNTTSHDAGGSSFGLHYNSIGTFLGIRQEITDLCPTTWYTLSMWIYADAATNCWPYMTVGGGYQFLKSTAIVQGSWNKYSASIYDYGTTTSAGWYVWCDSVTSGSFYIDDVSIART